MTNFLESKNVIEEKVNIDGIPSIIFRPNLELESYPTIIFYHGWSSNKESQRFRGFILSSLGFQVIIPDAIYHGERNPIDHKDPSNGEKYFWPVVFNNMEEFNSIIQFAIENYNADKSKIGVAGNSMGGFTTAGVFTHNKIIKGAVVYNGSCFWNHSNEIFKEALGVKSSDSTRDIEEKIHRLDPMNNLELIINRPILLLHGDRDSLVPIDSQRLFYEKAFPLYEDNSKIKFIEYPKLNHFVTTNMMEETAIWFKKFL